MFRRTVLLLILFLSCSPFLLGQSSSPDAARQLMPKLIPDPLPAQAVPQDKGTFYQPDNMYQYMDGGADIFLLYGVQTLFHQEFRAGKIEITADIFDMGFPENAFGIYAAERSPDYRYMTIGAEGYRDEGVLNFLQDRYYVKLIGFGEGADAVLETFARAISQKIGANPVLPALLRELPSANRKPHTDQYMPKDPLGHPFLSPAYVASYAFGEDETKLYVTVARDEADAQDRFKQLDRHFRGNGESKPAPELGEGAIRAKNSFEGSIVARVQGRYLVLLLNPTASSEKLLKDTTDALK